MKLQQQMVFHANRGRKGGSGVFKIFVDGVDTGVTREYDSGPGYRYTRHELRKGEEVLDLMKPGEDPTKWVLARLPKRDAGEPGARVTDEATR